MKLSYDPADPSSGHIYRENNSKGYRHLSIHSSTVYYSQDMEATYMSTDEWISKMCYVYTMEYCSTIRRNEIMPFRATWMDLDIIILSKSEKDIM